MSNVKSLGINVLDKLKSAMKKIDDRIVEQSRHLKESAVSAASKVGTTVKSGVKAVGKKVSGFFNWFKFLPFFAVVGLVGYGYVTSRGRRY